MKKNRLRLVFLFTGLLISTVLSGCNKKVANEDEIIKECMKPTVMITVGEFHASGEIISITDKQMIIASVSHLLNGFDQGIITFIDGHVGFADVFVCDEASDVALLKIKKEDCDEAFYDSLVSAVMSEDAIDTLKREDEVYLIGSAISAGSNVCKARFIDKDYYVPEFDRSLIYLYADVYEGMSGSGLFTKDGKLIGLLAGGSDLSEALCIPISDVIRYLDNGGIIDDKN